MTTNTPSFAYMPLHECRILRVSNSPHLCELCTTLLVVAQHISLCTISFLPSASLAMSTIKFGCQCRAVARTQPSQPLCVMHFFLACLSSWCLSRKGLAIPLNANHGCSLFLATPFSTSQCPFPPNDRACWLPSMQPT
uniref:Uncharacterized protein n=1 Tax=Ensete ventricosum TaxID=4639 RepID=A0A427A452_ENSVE|nr:hypothetical protein B296_00019502 [Ensete ventricosum]